MCGWRLGSFTSSASEAWADFGPRSSARSASGLGLANGHAGTTSAEAWEAVLALGWDRGVNCPPEYADASWGERGRTAGWFFYANKVFFPDGMRWNQGWDNWPVSFRR